MHYYARAQARAGQDYAPEVAKRAREAEDYPTLEAMSRSVAHWGSMKQWEIMQEYHLEDEGPALHGEGAEPRSWLTHARNVFELAPHRAAWHQGNDGTVHNGAAWNYAFQTPLVGKYFSTAWYELQVVLNSGRHFSRPVLAPVDWNYQPDHIKDLIRFDGPAHPYRLAATIATNIGVYTNRTPTSSPQLGFGQLHPARWAPGQAQGQLLDQLPQRALVYGALLTLLMDFYESFDEQTYADWPRTDPGNPHDHQGHSARVEPASYVPGFVEGDFNYKRHVGEWANVWYTMIPMFREAGVEEAVLERVIAFGERMWPLGGWDAVRATP